MQATANNNQRSSHPSETINPDEDCSPLASAVLRWYEQQFTDESDAGPASGPITSFPQCWGEFELLRPIGQGGMGYVYEARQLGLDRRVAIKVMRRGDPEAHQRFEREAKSMARVHSPHVVQVFHTGSHEGRPFFAMEYVEGVDLARMLATDWPPTPDEGLELVLQAARGLADAAAHGLIHRDLKPANMMLTRDGVLKLTDFGLARTVNDKDITLEGAIMGTPCYLSPEQAQGRACDQRSDIYSLGVVFYELLTGRLLFDGENPHAILYQHLHADPPSPRTWNPEIPRSYEKVLLRCLAKQPEQRYQGVGQLIAELEDLRVGRVGKAATAFGRGFLLVALTAMVVLALSVWAMQEGKAAPVAPAADGADPAADGQGEVGAAAVQAEPEPARLAGAADGGEAPPQLLVAGPLARADAALVAGDFAQAVAIAEQLLAVHGPEAAYQDLLRRCLAAEVGQLIDQRRFSDAVARAQRYAERHFWLAVDEQILEVGIAEAAALLEEDVDRGFQAFVALLESYPTALSARRAVVERFGAVDTIWVGPLATESALLLAQADRAGTKPLVRRSLIHGWLQGQLGAADEDRALALLLRDWRDEAVVMAAEQRADRLQLLAAVDAGTLERHRLLAFCNAHRLLDAAGVLDAPARWRWPFDCLRILPDNGIDGQIEASLDRIDTAMQQEGWQALAAGFEPDLQRIPILETESSLARRAGESLLRSYREPMLARLASWCRAFDPDRESLRWNAYQLLAADDELDRNQRWDFHRDSLLLGDGFREQPVTVALEWFATQLPSPEHGPEARRIIERSAERYQGMSEDLAERLPLHARILDRRRQAAEAVLQAAP